MSIPCWQKYVSCVCQSSLPFKFIASSIYLSSGNRRWSLGDKCHWCNTVGVGSFSREITCHVNVFSDRPSYVWYGNPHPRPAWGMAVSVENVCGIQMLSLEKSCLFKNEQRLFSPGFDVFWTVNTRTSRVGLKQRAWQVHVRCLHYVTLRYHYAYLEIG